MFIMDVHRTSSVILIADVAVDAVRFLDQLARQVPLEQPAPLERRVPPERRVPLERRAPLEQPEAVLAPALLQENC